MIHEVAIRYERSPDSSVLFWKAQHSAVRLLGDFANSASRPAAEQDRQARRHWRVSVVWSAHLTISAFTGRRATGFPAFPTSRGTWGSIGTSLLSVLGARQNQTHQSNLTAHASHGNPNFEHWLAGLKGAFLAQGHDAATAQKALTLFYGVVQAQANALSFKLSPACRHSRSSSGYQNRTNGVVSECTRFVLLPSSPAGMGADPRRHSLALRRV